MIRIEMNPLDQKDIIDLLQYALEQKQTDYSKEAYSNYWKIRVPQLLDIMNGKNVNPCIVKSTLPKAIKKEDKEEKIPFYW